MTHPPIIADSGAPEDSTDYTTVVLFHGYSWTSDAFRKMLPLAQASNARLILADRCDYRGATPYTIQERVELLAAAAVTKTEPDTAQTKVLAWMRERAREVYDLLVHIVREHKIPLARPEAKTGGITVGGWSFDPPDFALGLPLQNPIPDVDAPPTSAQRSAIALFYSGYFKHGNVNEPATYATTAPLPASEAVPTWNRLTPEDIETMNDPVPGDIRGGMDSAHEDSEGNGSVGSYDAVEVRHMWGDHSVAAMLWAVYVLRAELEKEKKAGTRVRKVTFARVEGANHFMPWDLPERTLEAILRG